MLMSEIDSQSRGQVRRQTGARVQYQRRPTKSTEINNGDQPWRQRKTTNWGDAGDSHGQEEKGVERRLTTEKMVYDPRAEKQRYGDSHDQEKQEDVFLTPSSKPRIFSNINPRGLGRGHKVSFWWHDRRNVSIKFRMTLTWISCMHFKVFKCFAFSVSKFANKHSLSKFKILNQSCLLNY